MLYTKTAIENRVTEIFPQITEHGIISMVTFNDDQDTWAITLVKGRHEFTVNMSKADADACMSQTYCNNFKKRLDKVVEYLSERE
jgi:hypothetical protein